MAAQANVDQVIQNELLLGSTIAGVADELILAIMPVGSAVNLNVYTSMTWQELY